MTRRAGVTPAVPRMHDVALRAGVSVKTVSRVVNGEAGVRVATEQRVRMAIAELGFHRNEIARSLASGKSHTIGLLIPNISNPMYAAVLSGAEAVAEQRGYVVIVGNAGRAPERQQRYLELFRHRRADGVLLWGFSDDPAENPPWHIAAVHLQPSTSFTSRWPMFGFANRESSAQVVDHLLALGHRHFLFLAGDLPGRRVTEERLLGYRHSLERASIPVDERLMKVGAGYAEEDGYRETLAALSSEARPRPTAIVACNGLVAVGAMAALSELGIRVPHEVSVVGMDDIPLAAYTVPRLTTVRRDAYQLAMMAAQALVDLIEGNDPVASEEVLIPGSLVIRESTARCAD